MKADFAHHSSPSTRFLVVAALVVAVALTIAPAALAFAGARANYDTTYTPPSPGNKSCVSCHDADSTFASIVVPEWSQTAHAMVGDESSANFEPLSEGPRCAGCHSGNYAPTKHQGVDDAGTFVYPPAVPDTGTDAGYSEGFVGCSTCHYNRDTAHGMTGLNYGKLANADICGQCHTRYGKNKTTYTLLQPARSATLQPEYTVTSDFNPFGSTRLSAAFDIPLPSAPQSQIFWASGQAARIHEEGAVQYEEWVQDEGVSAGFLPKTAHVNSLASLKALGLPDAAAEGCMECHSADYRIAQEAGQPTPTLSEAKYGDTCVTCHDPHGGDTPSVWNEERNAQLIAPTKDLCVECHNAEIPAGSTMEPGAEVHHPMKEMMDGYGAIDVPRTPSVHKGKCVQCHMVPTGYDRNGVPGTAGNHVFDIITPEQAATQEVTLSIGGTPTVKNMPYSSCSSCHGRESDPYALYINDTIEQRKSFLEDMATQVGDQLEADAAILGYADIDTAREALVDKTNRTASETNFLKAFTNIGFVESEGSWGIHNWTYATAIVNTALAQAKAVEWPPYVVTLKASRKSVNAGARVRLSGAVTPVDFAGGSVTIQRKVNGSWKGFRTATVAVPAGTYAKTFTTRKGTYVLRAKFPKTGDRPGGMSATMKITAR